MTEGRARESATSKFCIPLTANVCKARVMKYFSAPVAIVSLVWVLEATAGAATGSPGVWRGERRVIDLHMHVGNGEKFFQRAMKIMDRAGIGVAANLSGGYVTHSPGKQSAFERTKALADRLHPGRFVHYFNLNYSDWNDPDFSARAVRQVEEAHRMGAAGLKEYKRLGLYLRDKNNRLIRVDDPKLDPVWKRCGELDMPVSIHVADPRAFWLPYNSKNERWTELKDHKSWWFGDPEKYPSREEILASRNRVIERHPKTKFLCVHFANNPEDIDAVGRWLDRYPNMMVDLAARVPELGRHDPAKVRRLFTRHQDRILFATDFMVYNRLILGSGGSGAPPTDEDALSFYRKHWQWLETKDRDFEHMTPIQGDWTINAIGLAPDVLRKIYFDNARQLLARSLPPPVASATRIEDDFLLSGDLENSAWKKANPVRIEQSLVSGLAHPDNSTEVRILWSEKYLYLGYRTPFTKLTVFDPPLAEGERAGLWDRDVVEAFLGPDLKKVNSYTEYEVAPTGEKLDLKIDLPKKDLAWNSGFESAVKIDRAAGIWTTEMRIPLADLSGTAPQVGVRWRLNLYRKDSAGREFLAWSPTSVRTAHHPKRFGFLEFRE